MKRHLSRRHVLGLAASAFLAGCSSRAGSAVASPPRSRKRVVVVGAGLSGLSAAFELERAGFDVVVLEASARPGGRVHTIRKPFSDGLYAEAGATYVPSHHDLTLRYVRAFGLKLLPMGAARSDGSVFYVRGRRLLRAADGSVDWPMRLTAEERALGFSGMLAKFVHPVLSEIADDGTDAWPPPALAHYDAMSIADFLRHRGASEEAVALLRLPDFESGGDGADSWSALDALRESAQGGSDGETFQIAGGSELLSDAFASRLSTRIHFGCAVVKIEQRDGSLRIVAERAGKRETFDADYGVSAVPFSVLRNIERTPRFSSDKERAIDELGHATVTQLYFQTKRRPWRDQGLSGEGFTDLPLMLYRDATLLQRGERGILQAYVTGKNARWFASMSEEERLDVGLRQMDQIHPGVRALFEVGTSKCWGTDPFTRGGYAYFRPGQMTALLPAMRRHEGRLVLAGEQVSPWLGWMQGALFSGVASAKAIQSIAASTS